MDQMSLVVHESGRRWIDPVRVQLIGLPVQVRHSTLPRDCLELIRAGRQTAVLLELGSRPLEAFDLLEQLSSAERAAKVLVVADRSQASLELAVRELGAMEFLCEPISLGEVTELLEQVIRRQLAQGAPAQARPAEV